jgi:hypothetical protein
MLLSNVKGQPLYPQRRMIAPMQKVDVLAKNWFIIKKGFEGSTGTLVNLATEYGLACPTGELFQF